MVAETAFTLDLRDSGKVAILPDISRSCVCALLGRSGQATGEQWRTCDTATKSELVADIEYECGIPIELAVDLKKDHGVGSQSMY